MQGKIRFMSIKQSEAKAAKTDDAGCLGFLRKGTSGPGFPGFVRRGASGPGCLGFLRIKYVFWTSYLNEIKNSLF